MQITGIILSGGKSSRMGTDKALMTIDGKSLLERAIDVCSPVCNPVFVSSNNPLHKKTGIQMISDEIADCGPLGGIYSCLRKTATNWNFVLSVDAAFMQTCFIKFLMAQTGNFDAVVPVHAHGKEPLIALYHKNIVPEIEQMLQIGDFKTRNLFHKIKVNYADAREQLRAFPQLFVNLNKPHDYPKQDINF